MAFLAVWSLTPFNDRAIRTHVKNKGVSLTLYFFIAAPLKLFPFPLTIVVEMAFLLGLTFATFYLKEKIPGEIFHWKNFFYLLIGLAALLFLFKSKLRFVYYSFFVLFLTEFIELLLAILIEKNSFVVDNWKGSDFVNLAAKFFSVFITLILALPETRMIYEISNTPSLFNGYSIAFAFITAVIIASVNRITQGLSEKATAPLAFSILFYLFFKDPSTRLILNFWGAIILGIVIVYPSFRFSLLKKSGAIAAFLLAVLIFGIGGLKWSVPLLFFFFPASLLSKLRKRFNPEADLDFAKGSARDAWQVMANGGIGVVLILLNVFYPSKLFYLAYVASFASASADTWATEIGTLFNKKTVNIVKFVRVESGQSGGISVPGTIGGFAGAIIIGFSALRWIALPELIAVSLAGFLGCFFDSFLGSIFQLQYVCRTCGKVTERKLHCSRKTNYFKGVKFLNNDAVNFFASLFSAIIVIAFFSLYF